VLVGVSGGSCSGKTTLARAMLDACGDAAALLMFDDYYRDHGHLEPADRARVNFDHPDSLDVDLFCEHLDELRHGNGIAVPSYDFATHTRGTSSHRVEAAKVVLVDGILLLALEQCRKRLDVSVFVDAPADVRLARRIERDVAERGRTPDGVRLQFAETVAPMHDAYVDPSKVHADVVFRHPFEVAGAVTALRGQLGI